MTNVAIYCSKDFQLALILLPFIYINHWSCLITVSVVGIGDYLIRKERDLKKKMNKNKVMKFDCNFGELFHWP